MALYNLEEQTLDGEPIKEWRVWFATIKGTTESLEEAVLVHRESDIPIEAIQPVPVAISKTKYEIIR